jgi:hypothetical protein
LSELKEKSKRWQPEGAGKIKHREKLDDTLRAQLPKTAIVKPSWRLVTRPQLTDAYALQGDFTEIQAVRIVCLNGDAGLSLRRKRDKTFVEVIRSGAKLSAA